MGSNDARACRFDNLFENAFAEIAKHRSRCFISVLWEFPLDLRIHIASNHEKIWKAVVVKVGYPGAPADVAGLDTHTRATCFVVKRAPAVVSIQNISVIRKMGLEEI